MKDSPRESVQLLIMFIDLSAFSAVSQRVDDGQICELLDTFYERVARIMATAGGRVVKFIGDAALVVFPEPAIDTGVRALLELKEDVDRAMSARGWECRLSARAHFGTAIAGEFGPDDDRRYDVVGRAVNATAMIRSSGAITLSGEAFHRLSSELRPSFKEHATAPTYVTLGQHTTTTTV